jgi:hypothetical protein
MPSQGHIGSGGLPSSCGQGDTPLPVTSRPFSGTHTEKGAVWVCVWGGTPAKSKFQVLASFPGRSRRSPATLTAALCENGVSPDHGGLLQKARIEASACSPHFRAIPPRPGQADSADCSARTQDHAGPCRPQPWPHQAPTPLTALSGPQGDHQAPGPARAAGVAATVLAGMVSLVATWTSDVRVRPAAVRPRGQPAVG